MFVLAVLEEEWGTSWLVSGWGGSKLVKARGCEVGMDEVDWKIGGCAGVGRGCVALGIY